MSEKAMTDRTLAWCGVVIGVVGLSIGGAGLLWNVYTWQTERETRIEVDLYDTRIGSKDAPVVRVRNLSDHDVSIDRVRIEYNYGRILKPAQSCAFVL
jgi:hypothetical protein